ncbi:tyrosine-type recombinase/integrase [Schinkia azotoformans]|uniref:tyrosine-type recombinase/integrase n=1 Tax=Schinkia azotoformans TaxID=1454 RepID=UPI002E1FF0B5|nr:tyrosine-type recombinase/integrase [Schinkia azotoformans]MED4354461.1 tyrosine-type recombinase/integrase [Schinkia azotoformans]
MSRRSNQLSNEQISKINRDVIIPSLDFQTALDLFISDCTIRNLREYTIQYYRNELTTFYKMIREQKIDLDIRDCSYEIIKVNVIKFMQRRNKKVVSINTRLRAIRAFFNFLEREKYISAEQNPAREIKLIKERKEVVQTYTNAELEMLFKQPDLSTFTGIRDLTIMMLYLECGVRANEMINICVSDIDFTNNRILVRNTKGYKQRFVPIQDEMIKQLQKYLQLRGKLDHDYLWINLDNLPLAKHQMQIRIADYGKKIGIRATCHKFRHTFGRIAAENQASIFEIQAVLGHSSLEMCKHYVNLFSNDVIKRHKEFSPIEKMKHRRKQT